MQDVRVNIKLSIKDVLKQYNMCFDKDGNVKACGREECKKLIRMCNEFGENDCDYGNSQTGRMNVGNIKRLLKIEI